MAMERNGIIGGPCVRCGTQTLTRTDEGLCSPDCTGPRRTSFNESERARTAAGEAGVDEMRNVPAQITSGELDDLRAERDRLAKRSDALAALAPEVVAAMLDAAGDAALLPPSQRRGDAVSRDRARKGFAALARLHGGTEVGT